MEAVLRGPVLQISGQSREQAQVGLAAGLQGEDKRGEKEDRREGGEEGEAVGGGS